MLGTVPGAGEKSPATSEVVTVVAAATSLLSYAPDVFVTVKPSGLTGPDTLKFADVKVAFVLPSYGFVGSPIRLQVRRRGKDRGARRADHAARRKRE